MAKTTKKEKDKLTKEADKYSKFNSKTAPFKPAKPSDRREAKPSDKKPTMKYGGSKKKK